MTKIDLHILFHQETGKYQPLLIDEKIPLSARASEKEYIKWLEDRLVVINNMT
jgi:hypothetical protein